MFTRADVVNEGLYGLNLQRGDIFVTNKFGFVHHDKISKYVHVGMVLNVQNDYFDETKVRIKFVECSGGGCGVNYSTIVTPSEKIEKWKVIRWKKSLVHGDKILSAEDVSNIVADFAEALSEFYSQPYKCDPFKLFVSRCQKSIDETNVNKFANLFDILCTRMTSSDVDNPFMCKKNNLKDYIQRQNLDGMFCSQYVITQWQAVLKTLTDIDLVKKSMYINSDSCTPAEFVKYIKKQNMYWETFNIELSRRK